MADEQWGAGDRSKWHNHGVVQIGRERFPLIYGEHPHSRSDDRHYVEMHGEVVGFSGHRVLLGVNLESRNYVKDSELSGGDVRKGGTGRILADGDVVFEFYFRDVLGALLKAHSLITDLSEHASGWILREDRNKLVGRKLFYREHPAIVERLIVDQGCLILHAEGGRPFPPPVWRERGEEDEQETSVKVEVTDPAIWWWRE